MTSKSSCLFSPFYDVIQNLFLHFYYIYILYIELVAQFGNRSQSRQSAKLFLQSSELGLPHPLTRRRVVYVPLFVGSGGGGTLACEKGGVGVPRGQTLWYSRYICTLRVLAVIAVQMYPA
jgi:hypothetical protein